VIPRSWFPVPTNATTGCVLVTNGSFNSNCILFTVGGPPSITSLTPNSGPGAVTVTIAGSNFGSSSSGSSVYLQRYIRFHHQLERDPPSLPRLPSTATTGNVCGHRRGSSQQRHAVHGYARGPVLRGFHEPRAVLRLAVSVTGAGFGNTQGTSTVTYNGVPANRYFLEQHFHSNYGSGRGATTGNVCGYGGRQWPAMEFSLLSVQRPP